jgi:serine/threonine-protein kinase
MSEGQLPDAGSGAPTGNHLGKYRLIADLGHGGMADVYLAVVQGMAGWLVVLKIIRPTLAAEPGTVDVS